MSVFNFNCPQCGNLLSCEDEWRGMETQCPHCRKMIIIPPAPAVSPTTEYRHDPKKSRLITLCIAVLILIVCAVVYFTARSSTPTFMIEEMIGVNIGQGVTNKNPDNDVFSDYFHYFNIPAEYKGKILFEKVSFPASYSEIYIGSGKIVVSSPAAVADNSGDVRYLSVTITDRNLFADIMKDFADKGFGIGEKGYYPSSVSVHISDLLQYDFSKNEHCSFTSEDGQYQLYVSIETVPCLLDHRKDIPCARIVLSGKVPEGSRKGIRLLMNSNGFIDPSGISGSHKTAMYCHTIIHNKGNFSHCTHVDGFNQ